MTVVIACHYLKLIAVFADCRVSYQCTNTVDDNLQKIYQIGTKMVLGFSGPLQGAYQVIQAVRRNARTYSKRPIASNLQRDVERWIRREYREIRQPEHRKDLSFILATVEPSREARSTYRRRLSNGTEIEIPKPEWLPSAPELSTIVLKPSRSAPNKLLKEEKGLFKIIGVQDETCDAIRHTLEDSYGFAFKQPRLQAQAVVDWLMATLMDRDLIKVGGLFQCALLGTDGIQWLRYRLPSKYGDVSLDVVEDHFVQRDHVTGKTVPLRAIWEWCDGWARSHLPGDSGVFEDRGLRRAIDSLRKTNSKSDDDLGGE
jgi:hypothetical protein